MFAVEVNSALGSSTSTDKARWAKAHAQNKESWAQLRIGPTLEVMRGKDRDPAPISLNDKAGRATARVRRLRGHRGPNAIWSM